MAVDPDVAGVDPVVETGVPLPVLGTIPPPAGGGVEAPLPQALNTSAATNKTNIDKYRFFLIFSPFIFSMFKSYQPIFKARTTPV